MIEPNFFLVGAPKCGTSSLHAMLAQHPQIEMSSLKEPHYLMWQSEGLPDWAIKTDADYAALWSDPAAAVHGESSTNYLAAPGVPELIARRWPRARIAAVLRQPAERAFSAWQFKRNHVSLLHEPLASFSEALAAEEERRKAGTMYDLLYCQVSGYAEQVERYQRAFPAAQLRFYLFEDLAGDPAALWCDLLSFLEVDERVPLPAIERENVTPGVKNRLLHTLAALDYPGKGLLKRLLPARLRQKVKRAAMRVNAAPPAALDPAEHARLTAQFEPDIARLEQLLQRDLSHWRTRP